MTGRALLVIALLATAVPQALAEPVAHLHLEVDPLPFSRGGYGTQIGVRPHALAGLRFAIASFALDVPDFAIQVGSGNDGFHARVRPSGALYVLYYLAPSCRHSFAFGGSLRYLRLRYTEDDAPGEHADASELSPEAIAAFKWNPWKAGFYLQPWLGLSTTLWRSGSRKVGAKSYDPLPIQPFFTVNLGWEFAL
jgi:hypothetical protein